MSKTMLLLLAVIIVIIASGVYFVNYQHRMTETKLQLKHISKAIQDFQANCGRFPTDTEGLVVLFVPPKDCTTWQLPKQFKTPPIDPWGNSYRYRLDENSYRITSPGKDRLFGGRGLNQDIEFRP